MKYLITSALTMVLIGSCMNGFSSTPDNNATNGTNAGVVILSAPELKDLANTWVMEYRQVDPTAQIDLIDMKPAQQAAGIYLVTGNNMDAMDKNAWRMCLGHQAIVAVVNAKNPLLPEMLEKGLKAADFAQILSASGSGRLHPVVVNNPEILSGLAAFIRAETYTIKAEMVIDANGLVSAMQQDALAIGFCRLSDITAEGLAEQAANFRFVPIDKNGNGRMDAFENIYNNSADLARGIWIGKYPHELSGSLYAVSGTAPTDSKAISFLSWITSDGGKLMADKGFTALTSFEIEYNQAALAALGEVTPVGTNATNLMWLYILAVLLVVAVLIVLVMTFLRRTATAGNDHLRGSVSVFKAGAISGPHGYYFDKTHTWAFMEKNGNIRIGIDDFLQHVTGNISRVLLKENGTEVRRGEKILTLVKDGKQLTIYAPVSGVIKSRNNILMKNASMLNSDPYTTGWIYEIEPKNWLREIQLMFMGESYYEWMKEEFVRLRGFFETALRPHHNEPGYLILQDGGELKDHVLADLGPEIWEEFQTIFIDKSR